MSRHASPLNSRSVLGLLGSGQLARMTCLAASELGIQTKVYCPSETELSPAEQVATQTIKGSFSDIDAILKFCAECTYITLENEFIDQNILDEIEKKFPNRLFPASKTFNLIGDKISEKKAFQAAGLKVAPFKEVNNKEDIAIFCEQFGFPVVLKSAKGGYDGYGNVTLRNLEDIKNHYSTLKGPLLVEAYIPYEKELAILVARNINGEVVTYPIAHTMQENHICHYVSVPADISKDVEEKIQEMAQIAMCSINAVGLFAFEFFVTDKNEIFLNESAPRPHNSGHYTLEGCETSQFHNHVRSVFNLPLGSTNLKASQVMMLNLLGTRNDFACLENAQDFLKIKNGYLHLYGKIKSKVGRKMGHFTLLGNQVQEMKPILEKLKKDYQL